jgi:hypothetical protein
MPSCLLHVQTETTVRRRRALAGLALLAAVVFVFPVGARAADSPTAALAGAVTSGVSTVKPAAPIVNQVTTTATSTVGQVTNTAAPIVHQVTSATAPTVHQVTSTATPVVHEVTSTAPPVVHQVTGTATSAAGQVTNTAGAVVPVSPTAPPSSHAPGATGSPNSTTPAQSQPSSKLFFVPAGALPQTAVLSAPVSPTRGVTGPQSAGVPPSLPAANPNVAAAFTPNATTEVSWGMHGPWVSHLLPLPMPLPTLPQVSAPASSVAVPGPGGSGAGSLGIVLLFLSLAVVFAGRRLPTGEERLLPDPLAKYLERPG